MSDSTQAPEDTLGAGRDEFILFGAGSFGVRALPLLAARGRVHAFCDNDPEKIGTTVCGYPVLAPEDLPDAVASGRLVVITSTYRLDIMQQLADLGITCFRALHKHSFSCGRAVFAATRVERDTVLYCGTLSGSPERLAYLESIDVLMGRHGFTLTLLSTDGRRVESSCPVHHWPEESKELSVEGDASVVDAEPELISAIGVDAARQNLRFAQSERRIKAFFIYADRLLRKLSPRLCVIFNQFKAAHRVLAWLCKRRGIPVVYAEWGILPGTICFEDSGQMALSRVTTQSDWFRALPVDALDTQRGVRYLAWARHNRVTRRTDEVGRHGTLRETVRYQRSLGRKVIFVAGQNDPWAGLEPCWQVDSRTHSPYFLNTRDALEYVLMLAENNDWFVVFKPHPFRRHQHSFHDIDSDRLFYALDVDIFTCIEDTDVTVTIVSQTAYLALIHDKPVVLLGRMQLTGKGCTYEIGDVSDVGSAIVSALAGTGFEDMRASFLTHVAQAVKYYVFAFDDEVYQIAGRGHQDVVRFLLTRTASGGCSARHGLDDAGGTGQA